MTATYVLALIPIAFIVSILWAPALIDALRRLKFGKQIRLEGPASHQVKAGTPTMGGALFIVTTVAVSLALIPDRGAVAPAVVAMLVFGIAGALDDYANMHSKQGLGFKVRYKFVWHGLISVGLATWLFQDPALRHQYLPGGSSIDLGWGFIPLVAFAIFASAAGVNEVDGLDGLAGGTTGIAFASYLILALGAALGPTAAFCAAVVGSLLGFLWYNVHPAKVFMGDTGALGLGAGLAVIAFQTGWGLLLPIIGFVFVLDLVSVILQVGYFRMTGGKRIFPMTPIHHGFEVMGWPETLVTQRFWIMGILASAVGLALAVEMDRSTTALDERLQGDLAGIRATLIGLGRRTHVALARYLIRRGAFVLVSEQRPRSDLGVELELLAGLPVDVRAGGHYDDHVADADLVFVTPGVPRDLPVLETARRLGISITSEIELVFARCRAPIIGITGSAGKTTSTSLVGAMLRQDGREVLVGGNIGIPLVEQIDDVGPSVRVVLELSSFQLEGLRSSPPIGAILNVTPNHLDRHLTFDNYRESKLNLLRYQRAEDRAILGRDDPVAHSLAIRCPGEVRWFSSHEPVDAGAFRDGDTLVVRDPEIDAVFASTSDLIIPGEHNVQNVLAAAALARAAGTSVDAIGRAATAFVGVEHRLEFVGRVDGVRYVNDSIATSPERAVAALRTLAGPIVLIVGGRSKHLPLGELASAAVERCRAVVAYGEMADEVADAIRMQDPGAVVPIERRDTLAEGVRAARGLARPGDVVTLSPAGTSYDQYRDFEERGNAFKTLVAALAEVR